MDTNNTNEKFLSKSGLSKYTELLKDYIEKKYANKNYAENSDVENIVTPDESVESNEDAIVQVKTLSRYHELLKANIQAFSVKDNKPIVEINGNDKELATKEYVDSCLEWRNNL